ncbi:MAG: helix-turn-helix domain-containing protein [Bacillota bacterium]|jgi:AraC-like DNA-binding protein
MAVQIGEANQRSVRVGVNPVRQLLVLSKNTSPHVFPGQDEPVAITDFIYLPRCTRAEQLAAPQNYYMFILTKPNSPLNIVMIGTALIRKIDHRFVNIHPTTEAYRILETWDISNRLNMFYQEAQCDYPGRDKLLQDLAEIVTALMVQRIPKPTGNLQKRPSKDIRAAIEYIHNNCSTPMTLEEISKQVNYSQYHFIRIFKKETGFSPFEYLTNCRLDKARELLAKTPFTITEICLQCGFQNSSHFATVFKKHTGMSPSEYRQKSSP